MSRFFLQVTAQRSKLLPYVRLWRTTHGSVVLNKQAAASVSSTVASNASSPSNVNRPPADGYSHTAKNSQSAWKWLLGLGACIVAGYSQFRSTRDTGLFLSLREDSYSAARRLFLNTAKCSETGINRRSKHYNFLAEAVEVAAPAVVYIEKSQPVSTIFGEATSTSSGSGFVVDENGYVLTNAHVVGNAPRVKVKLPSGRVVAGEVTEIDQVADLALVKLDIPANEKLPALKFGSSAELRPGEWVIAMGSPLSLSNTITSGIVSTVHRPSKELWGLQKPDMAYVQTDAPITVGNSGGPLVNLDGEVIGVNTMTAGPGISFAIPSDLARSFVESANRAPRKRGAVERYAIGISMLSITPSILHSIQLRFPLPRDVTHGVFLANVWPNGAAAQAGLKRGDVIVRVNGKNIHSSNEVFQMVQSGKRLTMEIVRDSRWHTITVKPEPLYSRS